MVGRRSVVARIILALGCSLPASVVVAQTGFLLTPSLSATEVYDDNIFFSATGEREDFVSRVSPSLEVGYRSTPVTLEARHTFDVERYARNPALDSSDARRHSTADIEYRPTRLLTLEADASHTETRRPGELTGDTGLELGRARAARDSTGLSLSYRLGPRTDVSMSYEFMRDDLAGGIETDTHTATLRMERRISPRGTTSLGYTQRRFLFDGEDTTISRVATLGWTYDLTRRTSLSLIGGPRSTDGSVEPEISATVTHVLERGELSATYARSRSTVIGRADTVATERLAAAAAYSLSPALELRAAPSLAISTSDAAQAEVYSMDLEASYRMSRNMSLTGAYRFRTQQGGLDTPGDQEIVRNVVLLGITFSYPWRIGSAAR